MIYTSTELFNTFAEDTRQIMVRVKINGAVFDNDNISTLNLEYGSMDGANFSLGSTFASSLKITFAELVEGLAELDEIEVEMGAVLPNGTVEYVPMGTFIINEEVMMDRNNNTTSIDALDRMVMLGNIYESTLPGESARIIDIAVDIANQAGVVVSNDFDRLRTDSIQIPREKTLREAIGIIAQFEVGFATFNRDGELAIRRLNDSEFNITPEDYTMKGLIKNEVPFRLNGIQCQIGDGEDDVLQAGTSTGNQIILNNPSMTQAHLDRIYTELSTLNYYPFSLDWYGHPALEAGDWIEIEDLQGNKFKTPNLHYSLDFNGGLKAKSQAETTSSSEVVYQYKSPLKQEIQAIAARLSASGGNHVYDDLTEPENPKEGDLWFKPEGPDTLILKYTRLEDGTLDWVEELNTGDTTKNADAIEKTLEEVEEAKRQAKLDAEQALADAKAHAESEDARIRGELESEIGGAIEVAEQAKADAVTKANQALADAKAHADSEISQFSEHFDGVLAEVESDVIDAQATADSAAEQIDTAITNAGFTSLDETLQNMSNITMTAEYSAQEAIDNASEAYGLAQTSISEAQTAQANSLSALGQVEDVQTGVSSLSYRVDDVEAELELKADNTFMNEDGTLTTLSNAITFNAHRLSSDMSRIESRVESLAGEINLVILKDAYVGKVIRGTDIYPNPTEDVTDRDTMRDLIEVSPNEQLAFSKKVGSGLVRIHQYDENYNNIQYLSFPDDERLVTTLPNAKYIWISYPRGSQPQLIRGTEFLPYRPNLVDQMTSDEVVLFRNEYDEFADKTERRLSAIDTTGGTLDVLSNKITTTAESVVTDMTALINTKVGGDEFTEFYQNEYLETAQEVSRKISLSDIEVGGRNLIKNSDFNSGHTLEHWGYWGNTDSLSTMTIHGQKYLHATSKTGIRGEAYWFRRMPYNLSLIRGNEYTISWNQVVSAGTENPQVSIRGNEHQQLTGFKKEIIGKAVVYDIERDIVRCSLTFELERTFGDELLDIAWRYVNNRDSTQWVAITEPKLEIGNVMTDWTPAPEDSDAKIDHIETEWTQTFDTFSQTVSGIDGRVTSQKQTIDTISSTVSGHGGRLSTVEQTAQGLQTTVADKANQSQVTQLANGLSSVVESLPDSLIPDNNNLTNGRWGGWLTDLSINFNGSINEKTELYVDSQGGRRIFYPSVQVEVGKKYKVTFDMRSHVTGRKVSVGGWEPAEHRIGISSTSQSYEAVFEPRSTGDFSIYFYDTGTYEIGNVRVFETTLISETQISQLADNINLRVEKGDVINQINVSPEGILIDGKKTHITGTTTIDDGVIKDAHIFDLHADKITAGTIDAARIDAKLIVTEGLEVDVIEAEHILADTTTIDKLFATQANIDTLTAKTAFIDSIKAVEIDASKITSGTINSARINAIDIVTKGLTADVIESTHILADTALFDKLFTSDLATDRLSAQTAWIKNGMFAEASIDGAVIQDATIGSAKIVDLDVGKISGDTSNFIQSNWNAINSSININAERIRFDSLDGKSVTRAYNSGFDFHYQGVKVGRLGLNYTVDSTKAFLSLSAEAGQGINFAKKLSAGSDTFDTIFEVPTDSLELRMQKTLNINGNQIRNANRIFTPELTVSSGLSTTTVGEFFSTGSVAYINAVSQLTMQVGRVSKLGITADSVNLHASLNANGNSLLNMNTVYYGTNMEIRKLDANILDVRSNTQLRHVVNGFTMIDIIRTDSTNTGINMHANINMMGNTVTGQSDSRLKTNIADHQESSLQKINQFNFVDFTWLKDRRADFGVIAQQVQQVAPELILEGTDGYLSLNNSLLNMMTTHAVQELSSEVESNESKIHKLQQELSKANRRIEELESVM